MADKQYSGMAYLHGQWRYFVDKREDNGKFTAFMDSSDSITGGMRAEVATIPDFDTFDEAQNALDRLATKRKFTAECSAQDEEPEMEQQTFDDIPAESGDSVPPAENPPGMEQANDLPKSGDDTADSADDADETPDTGVDDGNFANDGTEQPPCDWKNASGDDDGKESSTPDNEQEPLPDGPTLSLRLPAFDPIFDNADESLRNLARAMKTKLIESGELSVKIVLNNYGGILKPDPKKCKVDCTPKPAKVSTAIHFPADLEIAVEQDGRVIVPEDREHQLSFEDNAVPGGTATVDGKTGIIEHYEDDGEDKPDGDDNPPENPEEPPQDSSEDDSGDSDGEEIEEGDQEHE